MPPVRVRKVASFHTPDALRQLFDFDLDAACRWFTENPNLHPRLREYQCEANAEIVQFRSWSTRPRWAGTK